MKIAALACHTTPTVDRVIEFLDNSGPEHVFTTKMLKDQLQINAVPRDPRLVPYKTKAPSLFGRTRYWGHPNTIASLNLKLRRLGA
jgi:hypothetical protein